MKKILILLLLLPSLPLVAQTGFASKKIPLRITKFGTSFDDDYTWLENPQAPEVKQWVAAQNSRTDAQMSLIKEKYSIAGKLQEYNHLSTNGLPSKKGRYFYGLFRIEKDKPSVLKMMHDLSSMPIEVFNPYKVYDNKNVTIMDYAPSKNSKYLACKVSRDGSDRHEIRFVNLSNFNMMDDVLSNIKFSKMAWNGDKGLFYKKNANLNVFAQDSTFQVYYHKIGKPQAEDELIFDGTKNQSDVNFFVSDNKLFIIENNKQETLRNFYYTPIDTETFILNKFISNDANDFKLLGCRNNRIYFSNRDYDWGEVRSFDLNNKSDEKVLIPQIYNQLLVDTDFYEDYVVCSYKTLGNYNLKVYDKDGNFIRKFDAPPGMDFDIRFYDPESKSLFVSFYSYTLSFHNFKLYLETGEIRSYYSEYTPPKPTLFPLDYFETKTITYKSRDNKDIPITIVHKKGIALDGNNPTLLKGYGGFGLVSGPNFDTGLLYFLEQGGVFAYAEIRGGGEKGLKWHKEGKGLKKINTFNDFIDAAEFLIAQKYTSPQKLAITGGSQGGLLVGVAMTQRPELFKVAIPQMGAFDMVKFQDYTIGKFHLDEYADASTNEGFNALMAYSPYHNIKEGVNYPTTLIITSENDDRVPPMHSFKFAARLQNRDAQKNPVLIKTLTNSGHYGKISTYKDRVDEKAEFYSFLLYYLNN
jgi:prolyl oligopeptidase